MIDGTASAVTGCDVVGQCTTGRERRITRWEHEEVVEAVQERLDILRTRSTARHFTVIGRNQRSKNPEAMRTRRETVEHPFGTLQMRMGATHFLMKTLPKVATEMALQGR
jgi:transposase